MQSPYPTATYPHLVPTPAAVPPHAPEFTTRPEAAGAGYAGASPAAGPSSGYPERVIEMLCAAVRQYGLSESAAAAKVGLRAVTLWGWKREFPEIAQRLAQAREACRLHYLQIIQRHAEAEDGRGFRAAAWLLERLFPGDYAPRMSERVAHQELEDRLRDREERALLDETHKQLRAAREAQREEAAQARKAQEAAPNVENAAANAPNGDAVSEGALHNVKNSGAAVPLPGVERSKSEVAAEFPASNSGWNRANSLPEGAGADRTVFAGASDLQNVRKLGEAARGGLNS